MKIKDTVGIDVSKKTIDVVLHLLGTHKQFENNHGGFNQMLKWIIKLTPLNLDEILFCFEHTGIYSMALASYLQEKKINYVIESGLAIKKSGGLEFSRGKNDKVDAKRIAHYAYLRRSELKQVDLPSKNVFRLKNLLTLRERMVVERAAYRTQTKEFKNILPKGVNRVFFDVQDKMIKVLEKQILKLETEIKLIVHEDLRLKELYELITTVKGVGFVLGVNLIVVTNCFTRFENSRKFACYSGIAPFETQSGTSINKRSKISHYANKKIKKLIHMAALSAIRHDPEMKLYYHNRVEKGKGKMSTINIVRNKIIGRVFAVVKRGTPFVAIMQYAK